MSRAAAARPDGLTAGLSGVEIVDLWARAVIASARAYGDDPITAMAARGGKQRRSLAPAASALGRVGVCRASVAGRVFGLATSSVLATRAKGRAAFLAAESAAMRAVESALAGELVLAPENWVTLVPPGSVGPDIRGEADLPAGPPLAPPPVVDSGRGGGARTMSALRVRAEVMECLEEEPCSGPELMQLVGVGEGQIRAALQALADEGRVRGTPLTAEGWAARTWRIA